LDIYVCIIIEQKIKDISTMANVSSEHCQYNRNCVIGHLRHLRNLRHWVAKRKASIVDATYSIALHMYLHSALYEQ
jgi:hypothetical protein